MGWADLFKKPILTGKRKKALTDFRSAALKALSELQKRAHTRVERTLYVQMARNVEKTPLVFYPRKVLRSELHATPLGPSMGVTQGEHVNAVSLVRQGSKKFLLKSDYINLPSKYMFVGDTLTISGIFTLAHEYGHFSKPLLVPFAAKLGLDLEQAEELMADILSAKLAVTLGYPRDHVLRHFEGREIVYGFFPFRQFILRAISN